MLILLISKIILLNKGKHFFQKDQAKIAVLMLETENL